MRTSPGCLACKRRKKRCDLTKPVCKACQRNSLICAWKPSTDRLDDTISNPEFGETRVVMGSSPGISLHEQRVSPLLTRPGSRFLYSHFIARTSHAVSVRPEASNPFLQILVPMASHSDMVLQAVLALSGIHYLEEGNSGQYYQVTWEHYAQALRSLKYGLTHFCYTDMQMAIPLSVCTLLFCFIELARGDADGNVFHHLKATRHLLSSVTQTGLDNMGTHTYNFILEWYSYLLVLSMISEVDGSLERMPLISRFITEPESREPFNGVLYGCAHDLFGLIPHVSAVAKVAHTEYTRLGGPSPETTSRRNNLLTSVIEWQPLSTDSNYIRCGEIYQLALLSLLQVHYDMPGLQTSIARLPNLLLELPVESSVTTTLCWPLGILGSLCGSIHVRDCIRAYLVAMTARYKFGNIKQTLTLLETLWAKDFPPEQMGAFALQSMMEANRSYFILA